MTFAPGQKNASDASPSSGGPKTNSRPAVWT